MRAEFLIKGKSLTGTSDLTLLAPILPGLVPSLDSITYKTRVKRLLRTLQGGRVSLHEYAAYRPLSDAVERVAAIHSFRVAVLEPENKVLLAVTFDGTWESYIRVLWQKVGTLLDIIFCSTEGYVVSHTASFEAWTGWVRRVQVETSFYYNTHGLTVPDAAYLRGEEEIHRTPAGDKPNDLLATRHVARSAEDIAWEASQTRTPGSLEALRQGLQSLAVLFRQTDTHLPGTRDGDVLKRAARDLLAEFMPLANDPKLEPDIANPMKARFSRQLAWLNSADDGTPEPPRPVPVLPDQADVTMYADLQAGILRPYVGMTHGCALLIAVDDPLAGALLLDELLARVTTEATRPKDGAEVLNVAVSYEGLRALGLSETELALFPQEFREGMEARASMLGDFRANHPRRWRLPLRNWGMPAGTTPLRVEMSAVHLVVQLRVGATSTETDPTQPGHPLHATIAALFNRPGTGDPLPGIRLLHVQGLQRHFNAAKQVVDHFDFADGDSDPVFDLEKQGHTYRNRLHVGEFLLGRDNVADVATPPRTPEEKERMSWLKDGSFLVLRKLAMSADRLHNIVREANRATGLPHDLILAKMMGRERNGTPLGNPTATGNDFDYANDAEGSRCPFHAHIRRANPRPQDDDQKIFAPPTPPGGRQPRLLRRGMSYGPRFAATDPTAPAVPDGEERGMLFMAYNASISEQFEVVQRWLSGGNSSGGHSRQSDPFLGVPDVGENRTYRFEVGDVAHRIMLDAAPDVDEEPQPLVQLEWGIYLFTPALPALRRLRTLAAAGRRPAPVWSADEGEEIIRALRQLERTDGAKAAKAAWKAALEDPEAQEKYRSAGVWAAIRARHGGALRTPYGVLVADRAMALQVLSDTQGFTAAGYCKRMQASIGEIFLGLDAGGDGRYERESKAANDAIQLITEAEAFALAHRLTTQTLAGFMQIEMEIARRRELPRWELNLDAKEVCDKVLARMCQEWFGLPADPRGSTLVPGSWRWDWQEGDPAIYPAQFTAPSRYIFQPWPNREVESYGQRMGLALTAAIARFIAPHRAAGTVPQTPEPEPRDARLASAILKAFPGPEFDGLTARNFCGALMGFLPTVDGNFRLSLNEWLRDGTFWSLRAAWGGLTAKTDYEKADTLLRAPLVQALQLRPSPELVWRRAKGDGGRVGGVDLQAGDTVVVSLVSAAHQCLAAGSADASIVFGGARRSVPPPTHACPGYQAGMGTLLGLLAGLVAVGHTMRASPAPLAFTFDGRSLPAEVSQEPS